MLKRIMIFVAILLYSLTITGCWGKRELNEIGIVYATGVDLEADGEVRVTVLAVIPVGGAIMMPTERSNTWIGTATGSTVADASQNLRYVATKKLVWFHNRLIVIGEKMARDGLNNFIDFLSRNREIRFNSYILVTEGEARKLLMVPADIQKNLPVEIEGMINNYKEWSRAYVPSIKDFLESHLDVDGGNIAGKIGYIETTENTFSTNRESYMKLYLKDVKIGMEFLDGSAVFRRDRLAGWLNGDETRGYMWITNKAGMGIITIKGIEGKGKQALAFNYSRSDISAEMNKGKILITVKLKVRGCFAEQTDMVDLADMMNIKKIEKSLSEAVIDDMRSAVTKSQREFKSDIFGFGGVIQRKFPQAWKTIGKKWDSIFPDVEVRYAAKVIVRRMGETTGFARPEEESD